MTSNRFSPKFAPIRYDPESIFIGGAGLSRVDQIALTPRLEEARRELLADVQAGAENASLVDLPERMLAERVKSRAASELGHILATAKQLRDGVDRVIVLGSAPACVAARALFEACCHPYHNELGRGDRGGRPRIYFEENPGDNDAVHGLLDLLEPGRPAAGVDDRWGMIVVDSESHRQETAAASWILLDALIRSCGGDEQEISRRVALVAESDGSFSPASGALLLPASVLGLDIVRLLEGAAGMNERFQSAPAGDNPALDYAAVCHLMELLRSGAPRGFASRVRGFGAFEQWHDQILTEAFGVHLHGRAMTRVIVERVRRDRLKVSEEMQEREGPAEFAGKTLPEVLTASIRQEELFDAEAGWPCAMLRLPALDESTLGQLFQMLLLATLIERRLLEKAAVDGE